MSDIKKDYCNIKDIQSRLSMVDWNFTHRSSARDIHSIHPYPAKFIAEIPRNLMKELKIPKGTWILDPFCGSGTTLVEAQRMEIPSIGIDLNPIACLISKVKTSPLNEDFVDYANTCVVNANKNKKDHRVEIKNVDHWFKHDIQGALQSLLAAIERVNEDNVKDALKLCVSSIIVRVSNQESDTRYAAVEKNVCAQDVFEQFLNACKNLKRQKDKEGLHNSEAIIINKDILKVTKKDIDKEIGMVITSPPYPNAYEYWLYHKYRMWWLGFDAEKVKEQEIGARAHYFKKNAQTPEDFKIQMKQIFKLFNQIIIKNGYVCVVIGRSIIRGEYIDNAQLIQEIAESYGMETIFNTNREIAANRKSFNLSHANIKKENLLVFQKK